LNGASHIYIGFYQSRLELWGLQDLCPDNLPVAGLVPLLERATHEVMAEFFQADFCYTISTDYGSNYVALPSLIDRTFAVVVDEKCHKSVLTGIYLAETGCVRKFHHNECEHLETILGELKGEYQHILVFIEGLYR